MSYAAETTGPRDGALALVESPVQLLNVLEWAHSRHPTPGTEPTHLTLVILPPHDPMTRGQLRRMAELARDEGHTVRWQEARGGGGGGPWPSLTSLLSLTRRLRHTHTLVIGDPFSRYLQLLLTLTPTPAAPHLTVVDDGTATMEFVGQLARGERFTRWHRKKHTPGLRARARTTLSAPLSRRTRRHLTPREGHTVELFTAMPVDPPPGITLTPNDFAWTRSRFGPPRLTRGTDLVGTSLVETGVVDTGHYLRAVTALARTHHATRYFAHRRESGEKLQRVAAATGLEIVRPDLPLELIARRGPIGRKILSFPSTVVHTLPLALAGTDVTVAVHDIDPTWLTDHASPAAKSFLADVAAKARRARKLPTPSPTTPHPAP